MKSHYLLKKKRKEVVLLLKISQISITEVKNLKYLLRRRELQFSETHVTTGNWLNGCRICMISKIERKNSALFCSQFGLHNCCQTEGDCPNE